MESKHIRCTVTYNLDYESSERSKYNRCKRELIEKYYKFMNDVIFTGTIESPKSIIDLEKRVKYLKVIVDEEKDIIKRCSESISDDIDKEIIKKLKGEFL